MNKSLQKYKGLQIQEADLPEAKQQRADLNALAKNINGWRLHKEREWMAPFQQKKDQCNKIVKTIQDVSNEIDTQVKEYEARADEEKKLEIRKWWNLNGNHAFTLEQVWDDRYLNKGWPANKWQADLEEKKKKISKDVQMLSAASGMDGPKLNDLLTNYASMMDASEALAAYEETQRKKLVAEDLKKQQESFLRSREAQNQTKSETGINTHPEEESNADPVPAKPAETLLTRTMKVQGTKEQIIALSEYMNQNQIRFWKVEE